MPDPVAPGSRRHRRTRPGVAAAVTAVALVAASAGPAVAAVRPRPAGFATTGYGFAAPAGEATSNGDIWITNRSGNSVTEITGGGTLIRTVKGGTTGLDEPTAVVASASDVWIADHDAVTELDAGTGAWVRTITGAAHGTYRPVALALAGSDLVVVNAGGVVTEIAAATGAVVLHTAPHHVAAPTAVAVAEPNIWITDTAANTVTELKLAGLGIVRTVSAAAGDFDAPDGIAFTGSDLWVADSGSDAASEITTAGTLVRMIDNSTGSYGFDAPGTVLAYDGAAYFTSPPGSSPMITKVTDSTGAADWYMCNTNGPYDFADPSALVVEDGRLWVANETNDSVTVMDAGTGALDVNMT
jgi:hypothetical protein